jgi:hypothetical protein
LLSGFLNLVYRTKIGDAHCGMRALRRDVLPVLDLCSTGMEFASEMVIRASKTNLDIREVPIALHPRGGKSKLSPFRDAWRHVRLILVYSPNFLFVLPGALIALLGAIIMITVFAHVSLFGHSFFIHTLVAGSMLVVVGTQVVGLGLCGRAYGVFNLGERDRWLERMQGRFRLEHGLLLGGVLTLAGLAMGGVIVGRWVARGLGGLSEARLAILSATAIITGVQVVFTSFLLSILGLRRQDPPHGSA